MFVINEQLMNGTVTMDVETILVNEDTWGAAVKKVKSMLTIEITECNENRLTYTVPQTSSMFTVWGIMKNKEAKTL